MDWWNQGQNNNDWWNRPATDTTEPQSQGFFGDLIHGAEHGAENVGHFFGGIAKDVVNIIPQAVNDFKSTVGTFKDMATAVVGQHKANAIIDQANEQRKKLQGDYDAKRITLDEFNTGIHQVQATLQKTGEDLKNEGINKRDTAKSAGAAFNTVLNIGTLGGAGLVEQGAKIGVKAGIPALEDIAAKFAEKKAATAAVEAAANRTATGATRTIVENAGSGALLGAGYGAAAPLEQNGSDATPADVWHSALFGGVAGGILGGGATLLDRNVRAGVKQVPGALQDANAARGEAGFVKIPGGVPESRPADALQTQLEAAWNGNDLPGAQKVIDQLPPDLKAPMQSMQDYKLKHQAPTQLDAATNNAEITRRQLTGEDVRPITSEQTTTDAAQATAANYKSPGDYITQRAKMALADENSKQGGIKVPTADGYARTSEHAPWYSDYYASTGRAPSLQATKDLVEQGLKTGRGVNGLIHPEESTVYDLLQHRESGLQQTIKEGPPAEMSAQYMDHLAGTPEQATTSAQRSLKLPGDRGKLPTPPELPPTAPAETFPDNQRGFFRNIRTSETATPELKQAVKEVNPQTYSDISTNRDLVNKAVQSVDENPQAIHDKITSGNNLNDQDVVSGLHLMGRYQQEGKLDEAVRLADSLDTNLREHGRAVQAASVWNRLSPEGVLRVASNRFSKAREKISAGRGFEKGTGGEEKTARTIQDTIEKADQVSTKDVKKAVRDVTKTAGPDNATPTGLPAKPAEGQLDINGKPFAGKEPVTTAEKIAANVEKMATPAIKKKADLLVKEITKKVKQEMIDSPKATARSPLDVMREVFGRNQEAQEAFPEAQRILMEKAKDNPQMQEALQKFFDSELGNPVASSTINAAIKEQMIKSEARISDIISKSWNQQIQSVSDIATALTKEGFDEASAKVIAKEVTDRLKAQVVIAKQKALQHLAKEVPKRQKTLFLDKVSKLSNIGALDSHDYIELARAKLKLPQLSESTAKKISDLAQKMQDMAPGYERDKIGRQIYATINAEIPKTLGEKAAEAISAPKAIMASYDLSGVLRQGGVLGSRFRKEARSAFAKQLTYFKSSDAYEKGMSAIRHDPMYETAARAKIALTGVEGGEEAFISQLPERIPIFGKGVQASDRAYTGSLTELRFNAFKHIADDLKSAGIDITSFSDEKLQSIGKFINTASGRGYGKQGGLFEKMAPALNRTLFSPRLWKSRLDMLNPVYYAKLDPVARKYALQSAGDFAAIAASVLGLASLMGAKVETDPRSSDFLKIRFGDTRYDILGGFQQNLVFAARELSGSKKNSSTGEVKSLTEGGFGGANRLSILSDLIQNKENPVIGAGADILRGTDQQGNPTSLKGTLGSLVVPLNIQDTYTIAKSSNPLQALLTGTVPGSVGVGVNTYPAPDDSVYKKYADALAGR